MNLIERLKQKPEFKETLIWLITSKRNPRPRLWVKICLNPFVHKKGKNSVIRRCSRVDVFPWKRFDMGDNSTIEDFCTINNGAGDVVIGSRVRVGIGSVVIGPVVLESGVGLGQHVFISGFNHVYANGEMDSRDQGLQVKSVVVEEEAHIGANSVVVAGVRIGKRCQIGAGSVVTKDIPAFSIAVGNPAKVIKQYNHATKCWERVSSSNE